jgi:DNA repair protein RAD51
MRAPVRSHRRQRHPSVLATPQQHGVAAADIKKLKEGGVHTIEHLAHAPKKQLSEIKGLSEAKVEKMQAVGASLHLGCPV